MATVHFDRNRDLLIPENILTASELPKKRIRRRIQRANEKKHRKYIKSLADNFPDLAKKARQGKLHYKRIYNSDCGFYRFNKKYSNRIIRRSKAIIPSGNFYKKFSGINKNVIYY